MYLTLPKKKYKFLKLLEMKNILKITSSFRGEDSMSSKLANEIVKKLTDDKLSSIDTIDLSQEPLSHLSRFHIESFFTPESDRVGEMKEIAWHSDAAIDALLKADKIVIGVAMYNFGISSTLKSWIDYIAIAGKTFKYTENGAEGLIKNKKVYLAIATGGVYSNDTMKSYDYTESYLRTILGFMGMTDITVFRVEGVNIPGIKETVLEKAINSIVI